MRAEVQSINTVTDICVDSWGFQSVAIFLQIVLSAALTNLELAHVILFAGKSVLLRIFLFMWHLCHMNAPATRWQDLVGVKFCRVWNYSFMLKLFTDYRYVWNAIIYSSPVKQLILQLQATAACCSSAPWQVEIV